MPRPPSQLIETSLGAVEFARHDTGAAVIISHSTGGGYDQGLMIARLLDGFQAIAVSRAGYLRTPLTTGQSHPRGSARMPDIRSQTGIAGSPSISDQSI